MSSDLRSKFVGCILGQALGDALGYPVEGCDEQQCMLHVKRNIQSWFAGETPPVYQWSGQYTDDTQLARELLISLVENKGFDASDYAQRIAGLFRDRLVVGRGIATADAADRLIAGVDWKDSGCPPPDAGNGTAMRAAPVGLFYLNHESEVIETAHLQGWITHQDPRCSVGSIAIAGAVALAVKNEWVGADDYLERLFEMTRGYRCKFADYFLRLIDSLKLPPSDALGQIQSAGVAIGYVSTWPGISPFVIPSVLWSLYSFLSSPDSFHDAICTSIAVGGDVDTTAAMTGAIAGAHLGVESLPGHLLPRINDNGSWGHSELSDLATRCYELAVADRSPTSQIPPVD
jgi:ADP-ribosylglycohydrolase